MSLVKGVLISVTTVEKLWILPKGAWQYDNMIMIKSNILVYFSPYCYQVNGRNILSVDYDRTLRTEKIYDDHRKFLLKIIYDTAGHPVLWVPSSKLLPVNVSRTNIGLISALQRGPTTERLEYDTQGRLVSRVFADGKIWSYTYLEQVRKKREHMKWYLPLESFLCLVALYARARRGEPAAPLCWFLFHKKSSF